MGDTGRQDARFAGMLFSSVYPLYLAKVERKGRTREELDTVIRWLTGFDEAGLQEMIEGKATFEAFFGKANLHPDVHRITGMICGHRIEDIENPLTRQVRRLDKIVDELAKGRSLERIMKR
jgi:hypothetical protein